MKRLLILLLAFICTGASVTKPTHITVIGYDSYGGVTNVSCTNPNGTSYFGLVTLANHKIFCDPSGHPYFGRGFYVFDYSSLGNDESGNSYNTYVTAKYGAGNMPYAWETAEVSRMKAWGFNMIGPVATAYALAFWPWTSGTNPNKVPYIMTEDTCHYSWINLSGIGSAPVKDVLTTASPNWHGTGYYGFSGVTDYEDPAWTTFTSNFMSASGDFNWQRLLLANSTDKSYLLGVIGCDTDYTHGFNGGPDYVTTPTAGDNDFRLSYEVALGSPVEWASTHQNQIYTDSTVYNKKTWHDQLTGEYASISALNTAWGSTYTTFETSGTCFGTHWAAWICPAPSAAKSVGTGNGSTLTFSTTLNTTTSANSVGIFVAGVLVGGDGGNGPFSGTAGTMYGPNMSGTINYATGALSITFSAGHAPANAAAITAEYIQNGWGTGTGVMDEDGRSGHQSWTGNNSVCIDGVGVASACSTGGGTMYASAGMASDLNTLDTTLAAHFGSVYTTAIHASFPGALFFGPQNFGTWTTPPNRYVIAGMSSYVSVGIMNSAGPSGITQSMLDFVHTYGGDMGLGLSLYNTANKDSPFAWPNSNCTHSGTTVTCTVATPQNFSTGLSIDTSCTDSTYNVTEITPSSVGATTVVYTASGTPAMASTTCNVDFSDANVSSFSTMAARANNVGAQMSALTSSKYTADGVFPFTMLVWWQWSDKQNEFLSWGVVDTRDNAYNGFETTTSSVTCKTISYNCGGELRSGWGTDDGLTPLINANTAIDTAVAGF